MPPKMVKREITEYPRIKRKKQDNSRKYEENFDKACIVEFEKACQNYTHQFQLLFLPSCSNKTKCKHESQKPFQSTCISHKFVSAIETEISGNMWFEALELSYVCITLKHYLSLNVLKSIVEIMLNAHEDVSYKHNIMHIISKCEQVLAFQFRMHPPCPFDKAIMCLYTSFLIDPMTPSTKDNNKKHSTRNDYGCDEGIFIYCLNRLENEIISESKDGPLFNKDELIPNNLKESVKGLHYEKENLEIYELLERSDRIDRLMAVLRSIVELLQFNIFIIESREIRQRYLINTLFATESMKVPKIVEQIMKLFAYLVHLDYPREHIKVMSILLNIIVEINFKNYRVQSYHYSKVPEYAKAFYDIIADFPHESFIKILSRIQPDTMKKIIGQKYCSWCLQTEERNILNILIKFLNNTECDLFPQTNSASLLERFNLVESDTQHTSITEQLSIICKDTNKEPNINKNYQKFHAQDKGEVTQDIIISALYITVTAYLDLYKIENINKTLKKMMTSEYVSEEIKATNVQDHDSMKSVYKDIYQKLSQIISILNDLKQSDRLPRELKVFEKLFKFKV